MTESAVKDREFHENLNRDLNLEITTPVKEIRTEPLRVATDSACRHVDTTETSKLVGRKEVGLNLEETQTEKVIENDQQLIKKLQLQEDKSGGSMFEAGLHEPAITMAPLPMANTFSEVQSPTTSTVSALTSATVASTSRTHKNKSKVHANQVSLYDNSEISNVGEDKDKRSLNSANNKDRTSSKSFTTGNAKVVPTSLNLTGEEANKSRSEISDAVTASQLKKKQILIDSLRDKNCTVASVLSTLMKSSKDVIDEAKFSELQSSSTVRLSREDLLDGETFTADYSQFHGLIMETAEVVEEKMDEIVKVLIIDAYNCVQRESKERQHNAILEAMSNHETVSKIGDATSEALEKEDRVKAATLENIIDTKMSGIARRFFSEATLQMSKLVKKAIETEKRPLEKVRYQAQQFDKRIRKKAKRKDERQRRHTKDALVPYSNATATVSNFETIRHFPSISHFPSLRRELPERFYHKKEGHLDSNRGRGKGGNLNSVAGRGNMHRSGTNARQITHRPHYQGTGGRTGNFHTAPFRGGRPNQMRNLDQNQRQRNVDQNQGQRDAGGGRGGGWIPNPTRK